MSKIINLKDNERYQEELQDTLEFLDDIEHELRHRMFVLATLDKWKEWADEQEPGTQISFTDEMLQSTGDGNIDILFKLKEKVAHTFNLLSDD